MYWTLLYYLDTEIRAVSDFRKKYDPTARVIPPHVPIVFPVPDSLAREEVRAHTESILDRAQPFSVHFRGFEKSPDHWMFLKIEDGGAEFSRLFEALYTGPLLPFRRRDVTFVPHLGLGLFVRKDIRYDISAAPRSRDLDVEAYRRALLEAESLDIDIRSTVTSLYLVDVANEIIDWARGQRIDLDTVASLARGQRFDLRAKSPLD